MKQPGKTRMSLLDWKVAAQLFGQHPKRSLRLVVISGVLAGAALAHAAPPSPAHWSVQPARPAAPSAVFSLTLTARIDPGWHLYALQEPEGGPLPTVIGLAEGDPLSLLDVTEREPQKLPDPFTHALAGIFQGTATFTLKLRAPRTPPPADATSHILVRYQTCNDQVCLPPHTETVPLPLRSLLK